MPTIRIIPSSRNIIVVSYHCMRFPYCKNILFSWVTICDNANALLNIKRVVNFIFHYYSAGPISVTAASANAAIFVFCSAPPVGSAQIAMAAPIESWQNDVAQVSASGAWRWRYAA